MSHTRSKPVRLGRTVARTLQPTGVGKCLLKVGGRPDAPARIKLTDTKRRLHDTNAR
jgi:hypothetical protein